jgi:hypothetical protein
MAEANITGTEGMGAAREAFNSAMDAEKPSRSKAEKVRKEEPSRIAMEDLFPRRELDRREREGGLDEPVPPAVKRAREEARQRGEDVIDEQPSQRRGKRNFGEVEDREEKPPRDPTEGNDEDEIDDTEEDDDEELPEQEGEDEEEDEEESAGLLDLSAVVEVNIDGEAQEVSLKEAVRGYIRQETFHRRMGELQQGVAALTTARTELDTTRADIVERAALLEQYVKEFLPEEPNWDEIYARNPTEGAQLERRWRTFQGKVNALVEKRAQTEAELAESRAANLRNFASANRVKMVQDHPEWKNEKAWKRDHDSMRRTARAEGYSDAEINQLYDARGVNILLKASKWDRMMATKPKPVRNGIGKPTNGRGPTPSRGNGPKSFDRAEKRLSRTGSIHDAAGVFERIIDRER